MYFRILHDEAAQAISYLLADLDAGAAVLIDPRGADLPLLKAMLNERSLQLQWVLLTHEHDDKEPGERDALRTLGAPCVDHDTLGNDPIAFGNEHLRAMATPGHTPGCLSFMWRDRLFCGDLLTVNLCPHQPTPALPKAMWESVTQKIFTLPAETLLFSSHAERARSITTVFEQRRWHPWFSSASRDEFLARALPSRADAGDRTAMSARAHFHIPASTIE
jgi:glyoxylase-like metal-dependent hydrolase (beta-lactamase superfamily II)